MNTINKLIEVGLKKYLTLLFILCLTISLLSACGSPVTDKIDMPYSSEDYYGADWTVESLTEHLNALGFTTIETVPTEPRNNNYQSNIFEIVIKKGLVNTAPWSAGEKYDPDDEITIYYNEYPVLTVGNCPDLLTVLTSTEMDYMTFANKYDGRYVEFYAYVHNNITFMGGTEQIIDVASKDAQGLIIRIGDRTSDNFIAKSASVGQQVFVSGKIDASWSKYYKQLYVECRFMGKR